MELRRQIHKTVTWLHSGMKGPEPEHVSEPDKSHKFPDIWTTMRAAGVEVATEQLLELPIRAKAEISHENNQKQMRRMVFTFNQRQVLLKLLTDHMDNPYPTSHEKELLMMTTGLNREQINVWFTNNRVRQGISCRSRRRRNPEAVTPIASNWMGYLP